MDSTWDPSISTLKFVNNIHCVLIDLFGARIQHNVIINKIETLSLVINILCSCSRLRCDIVRLLRGIYRSRLGRDKVRETHKVITINYISVTRLLSCF